jgi:hypothetical protein
MLANAIRLNINIRRTPAKLWAEPGLQEVINFILEGAFFGVQTTLEALLPWRNADQQDQLLPAKSLVVSQLQPAVLGIIIRNKWSRGCIGVRLVVKCQCCIFAYAEFTVYSLWNAPCFRETES